MPNLKASLRKHFLEIRKAMTESEAEEAAINAANNFLSAIDIKNVKTIAFYHPVKGEINPLPLLDEITSQTSLSFKMKLKLWLKGKKIFRKRNVVFALPTITNKDDHLAFHAWNLGDELKSSDIYPQLFEAERQEIQVIPDIIIVPLVGFDENCHRLGYGGGFYDKTIAKLKRDILKRDRNENKLRRFPVTVGYAYECQKANSPLPTEPHDMRLDFVVTDKCVYSVV